MIVSIMQPTYLPWMGYFDLIEQSDVFVFLDTVAFSRQSWQQRNRIATPQGPLWLTVPVRHQAKQLIGDVEIDNTQAWRHKHWMSFTTYYRRAPFWDAYAPALEAIYAREWILLSPLNIAIIDTLCELAEIKRRFVSAGELGGLSENREGKLVEICRRLEARTYLSPIGSLTYLESDTGFAAAGIELTFHNFRHPTHRQAGDGFMSHLSFLDALMNVGPEAASLMRAGRGPGLTLAEARAEQDRSSSSPSP
ncbi:MAG: WbqC family protein [Solirubrobacteraceae bacterium]|jgi:hypothetical protein